MAAEYIETLVVDHVTAQSQVDFAKASFADLQDGDTLVVLVTAYGDGTWNAPAGWTEVPSASTWPGCYYKKITDVASEPATWSFTGGASTEKNGEMHQLRGVDGIDVSAVDNTTGNPETAQCPQVTTTVAGALVLILMGGFDSVGGNKYVGWVPPSGSTLIGGGSWGLDNDTVFTISAWALEASAGLTSYGPWSAPGLSPNDGSANFVLAFAPSGGGGLTFAGWKGEPLATLKAAAGTNGHAEILAFLQSQGATSGEVVGALNELNGTSGVEFEKALHTYLGV